MLISLSLLLASCFLSEDRLYFHHSVLNHAPMIVEAEIIDANGRLKINEFYRGHLDTNYITIDGLRSPNTFLEPGYRPSDNLVHQKCILFLRESRGKCIPASPFNMAPDVSLFMSLVWVIQDSIYYGEQPINPGEVVFSYQVDKKHFVDYIRLHNKSMNTLCTASISTWEEERMEILKESLAWTLLFEETIEEIGRGGEPGLKILHDMLPTDTFTHADRVVLSTFVEAGKEKVLPQLDAIFQREMEYWGLKLDSPESEFWKSESFSASYSYLYHLMRTLARNKVPGWKEKVIALRNLFENAGNYVLPHGNEKMEFYMDKILKNY